MIAVVEAKPGSPPCVVFWVGRKGLRILIRTHCNTEIGSDGGVLQVPDTFKICPACAQAIALRAR